MAHGRGIADAALAALFRAYGAAALGTDPGGIAAFSADSVLAAGPTGSAVFQNDEHFVAWLRQVRRFNQDTGMTAMQVMSLGEPLSLSERHRLVSVEWGARFARTGDRVIRFRIAYLVERVGDSRKTLAYVSGKDQEQEMRALGLR